MKGDEGVDKSYQKCFKCRFTEIIEHPEEKEAICHKEGDCTEGQDEDGGN